MTGIDESSLLDEDENNPDESTLEREAALAVNQRKEEIKNRKRLCLRGKKFIDGYQARLHYLGADAVDSDESVVNKTDVNTTVASEDNEQSPIATRRTWQERDKLIKAKKDKWAEEDKKLGGAFNIFADKAPPFKPTIDVSESEYESTEDEASLKAEDMPDRGDDVDDDANKTIGPDGDEVSATCANIKTGSQGRSGEGCSTPRAMANHTMAPLRQLDISAVTLANASLNLKGAVQPNSSTASGNIADKEQKKNASAAAVNGTYTLELSNPRHGTFTIRNESANIQPAEAAAIEEEEPEPMEVDNTFTVERPITTPVPVVAENEKPIAQAKKRVSVEQSPLVFKAASRANKIIGQDAEAVVASPTSHRPMKKKVCPLPQTPKRGPGRPSNESIEFSYISPGHQESSVSMVDPVTDPRRYTPGPSADTPPRAPSSATRIPRFSGKKLVKDSGKAPLEPTQSKIPPPSPARRVQNAPTALPLNVTPRSAARRDYLTQETFDRLSRPREHKTTGCNGNDSSCGRMKDWERKSRTSSASISPSRNVRPISQSANNSSSTAIPSTPTRRPVAASKKADTPRAGHFANPTKSFEARIAGVKAVRTPLRSTSDQDGQQTPGGESSMDQSQPLTPFQPVDPMNMMVQGPVQSCAVNRIRPGRPLDNMKRVTLFQEDNEKKTATSADKPAIIHEIQQRTIQKIPEKVLDVAESETIVIGAKVPNITDDKENMPNDRDNESAFMRTTLESKSATHRQIEEKGDEEDDDSLVDNATPPVGIVCNYEDTLAGATTRMTIDDDQGHGGFDDNDNGDNGVFDEPSHVEPRGNQLLDSMYSLGTPGRAPMCPPSAGRVRMLYDADEDDDGVMPFATPVLNSDGETTIVRTRHPRAKKHQRKPSYRVLQPHKLEKPETPPDGLRRSTRTRIKPVREHLGERPLYASSPGGSRTLVGSSKVLVYEKRYIQAGTTNLIKIGEREQEMAARKRREREKRKQQAKARKEEKLMELKKRHRRGIDLNVTADSIVTSASESDSSDDDGDY